MNNIHVSVVLPTYNEARNVSEMTRRIKAAVEGAEVVVVDDNSPDETWRIAAEAGARVIRRVDERGLASALKRGIEEAAGDVVVWMDCDLSMPPEFVAELVKKVDEGADIAVGSRYAPGGRDARPFIRVATSRMINMFANALLPVKVADYDSGFVAVRKKVFADVPLSADGYGEYCIEFLCMAGLRGYRIVEAGYVFTDRLEGESKTASGMMSFLALGAQYVGRVLEIRKKARAAKR